MTTRRQPARSWAQATIGQRQSLLPETPCDLSLQQDGNTVIRTRIWQHGFSNGSVFIDLRSQTINKTEFLVLVKEQYPTVVGVKSSSKIAELNFDDEDHDNYQRCLDTGLKITKTGPVILLCKVLTGETEIVTLNLSELPFAKKNVLLAGLKKSLATYGEVLGVGTLVDLTTQIYVCHGYATLNIKAHPNQPLTHLLPWFGSTTISFRAVWSSMAPYCKYCHQDGHIIHDCPIRKKRFSCWGCGEVGHQQAKCPDLRAKKRKATTPLVPISVQPNATQRGKDGSEKTGKTIGEAERVNLSQQQGDQGDQHAIDSVAPPPSPEPRPNRPSASPALVESSRKTKELLDDLTEDEVTMLKRWHENGKVDEHNDMELASGRLYSLKELYRSKFADLDLLFVSHNTRLSYEEVLPDAYLL
jgi:hypothetical protein